MTPPVLERAKLLVEPAMHAAIESLDANLRIAATYHLGWTDEFGAPLLSDSGKGVRAALVVLGAEAVGADAEAALTGAVAVELIHNFSLIHDDIMDNDRMRRHRRTVWDVFGVGDAILVGDAMHALAFQVLIEDPAHARSLAATERLARATSAMIAGQAQDVALDRSTTATLEQCIAMEANKTGALLAQSVAIGAVLGGGSQAQIAALEQYGASLGVAFQAVDDILGIWGDSARTGKPVGNDLRERKKSMPVAVAFDRGGAIRQSVERAFGTSREARGPSALDPDRVRSKANEFSTGLLGYPKTDVAAYLARIALVLDVLGDPTQAVPALPTDFEPEAIRSRTFSVALGGLDRKAVRAYLGQVADELQHRSSGQGAIELAAELAAAGVRDEVEAVARQYLDAAIAALDSAEFASPARWELTTLANFIADREL